MAKTKTKKGGKGKAKTKPKAKPKPKAKAAPKRKPAAKAKPKPKPKAKAKPKATAKAKKAAPQRKPAAKAKPRAAASPPARPKSAVPAPSADSAAAAIEGGTARKTMPAPPPVPEPDDPPVAAGSGRPPVDAESIEAQFEEVTDRLARALGEAAGDEAVERDALAEAVATYGRIRESFGEPPEEYIVHFFGADGVGRERSRTPALRRPNASPETHQRWVNLLMEAAEAAARMPRR